MKSHPMTDDDAMASQQPPPPPPAPPTREESNLARWLQAELKSIAFTSEEAAIILAKLLLMKKAERIKSGEALLGLHIEVIIENYNGITIKSAPYHNDHQIIQITAQQIRNHILAIGKERAFVGIAFQIMESEMSYQVDYDAFKTYVDSVFCQYYPSQPLRDHGEGYMAPYFALVQSNGMGKTKLLYHFAQMHPMMWNRQDKKASSPTACSWEAKLILCRSRSPTDTDGEERSVYGDGFLDVQRLRECVQNSTYHSAYQRVKEDLESLVFPMMNNGTASTVRKIVLLFDGASSLLSTLTLTQDDVEYYGRTTGEGGCDYEALLFRLIRLWLSEKRKHFQIVAVFAASDSNLRNYRDLDELPHEYSRRDDREYGLGVRPVDHSFYPRGTEVFGDLVTLTTLGCLRDETAVALAEHQHQSEYCQAIPYGRPLFAKMHSHGQLTSDQLPNIVGRIMTIAFGSLRASTWSPEKCNDHDCWMSILGTRVQMGQPSPKSPDMARSLVLYGYATLAPGVRGSTPSTDDAVPRICFGPDPVCARIAMCFMDEEWSIEIPTRNNSITTKGTTKQWWAEKASELFSKDLVLPDKEKGGIGQVMVALYLLFCADEERKLLNHGNEGHCQSTVPNEWWYQTFSVRLDRWVDRLVHGGDNAGTSAATNAAGSAQDEASTTRPTNDEDSTADDDDDEGDAFFFNAIQVYANYDLQGYDDESWKELGDNEFLKHLYKAGVGFYTSAGCETIDMFFPLKRRSRGGDRQPSESYHPMVVSVQSVSASLLLGPEEVKDTLQAMSVKAKAANWKTGLCLLVLLGRPKARSMEEAKAAEHHERLLSSSVVQELRRDDSGGGGGGVAYKVLYLPSDDKFGLSKAFGALIADDNDDDDAQPNKKARSNQQEYGGN